MTSFIADQLLVPEHWHRTSQILCLWLLFVSGCGFWPEVVSFPLLIDHENGSQIRSGAYVSKSPNKYPRLFVDNHLGRCVAMAQHEMSVIPESKLAAFKGRETPLSVFMVAGPTTDIKGQEFRFKGRGRRLHKSGLCPNADVGAFDDYFYRSMIPKTTRTAALGNKFANQVKRASKCVRSRIKTVNVSRWHLCPASTTLVY
ncbi:hypothetical protein pipiens_011069 [Culex pipiens pipiens]|uniref:Uncharacterized protein n=1 Tax=Culex pipiens pipiens TaxID=38569 RepID=A0ABD1D7Q6_CULPP